MTTLKIFHKEKQDMRRVQVEAANQALVALDGRSISSWEVMRYVDLRDYVMMVFPDLKQAQHEVYLYYMDDDEEQVRITNDDELEEAFRLMQELAIAAGKGETAVCKITVVSKGRLQPLPEEEETFLGNRQKKMMALFVDLSRLLEKWEAAPKHQNLRRDLSSLLHEPGCQEALLQIMTNPKFASIFEVLAQEFSKGGNFSSCLVSVAQNGELEEIAKILLMKCPQARPQIERVVQFIYQEQNARMLSVSDCFEAITVEESKPHEGPLSVVFEADITCPDGTVLAPCAPFDKTWRIRNAGPTRWPEGSKVVCVGGDKMQAPESIPIPSVLSGSTIDFSIRMVAPSKLGRYTGYWRLCTAEGTRFGQRLWVDINVMSQGNDAGRTDSHVRLAAPAPLVQQHTESTIQVPPYGSADVRSIETGFSQQWGSELRALKDMGFEDSAKNVALLERHDGDLTAVISSLV